MVRTVKSQSRFAYRHSNSVIRMQSDANTRILVPVDINPVIGQ